MYLGFFPLTLLKKNFIIALTTYKNPKNNYLFVGTQTCKEPSTVEFSLRKYLRWEIAVCHGLGMVFSNSALPLKPCAARSVPPLNQDGELEAQKVKVTG